MKARVVGLWKEKVLKPRVRLEALEGVNRLELWANALARKTIWEGIKIAQNRGLSLGKMSKISEKKRGIAAFSQWKRANRDIRRKQLMWKSAFTELAKFTRKNRKCAVRMRLNHWKETVFQQKTAAEARIIEGGMRLAVVISLQARAAALQAISTAKHRHTAANSLISLWLDREKAVTRGKMRVWRIKTGQKSLFRGRQKALMVLKMTISISAVEKRVKRALFRKWVHLPDSKQSTSRLFQQKILIKSNVFSVSSLKSLDKPLISPFIIEESEDFGAQISNKPTIQSALLTLAYHAKTKPTQMIRKWKNSVKTDIPETNLRFKLFERMGKMAQKRDFSRYFTIWKGANRSNFMKICFRRLAACSHFTLYRGFERWRTGKLAKNCKIEGNGRDLQVDMLEQCENSGNRLIRLRFLSLLLRKRVASGFAMWKTERNRRDLEEIRDISRIQGIKRFLETQKSRDLATSFTHFRRQIRLKAAFRRFLIVLTRKSDKFSKKTAISTWRSLISIYQLRSRALNHLYSLQIMHLAAIFPLFTRNYRGKMQVCKRENSVIERNAGEIERSEEFSAFTG